MKKQDQVEENMSVENKISVNRRIEENYTEKNALSDEKRREKLKTK